MSGLLVRWLRAGPTALAAALLAACAVGPDFRAPAAPDVERYTKEPLAPRTSSTDAPTGRSQHFVGDRDIPQEWWTLFKSPALNAVIERALKNNPTLQSTIATLRAAKEAMYAQQGKYFPLVQANFNPTRQLTATSISPVLSSAANPFNLYTAQVQVSYTFDVWGLNRRTVESLQALADNQRFQVEAAYLTLAASIAVAAITEASLRGQIDATNQLIAINTKMLNILRRQLETGYADRLAVAAQEAALAQVLATLPPLRKALQQNRDLLSALAGVYTSEEPREKFKLADLTLPTDLPVSLPSHLIEQRPDVRAAAEQLHSASALIGVATANMLPNFTISANAGYMNTVLAGLLSPANAFWLLAGNATQTVFDGGTLLHTLRGAQATYDAAAWSYRGTVVSAVQNVADSLRAIQNDADALKAARDFERAAKVSLDLATQQLHFGLADELFLLNAQQTYLQAVIQVVQARAARLSDTAALFQALGGGWWNRVEPPTEKILNVSTDQAATLVEKHDGAWWDAITFSPIKKDETPQ
ncbi:MAG TPA: efflux transporter outer membrane subunit [Xanthobacteraceae bacterium]|nr:efflux transporter outer membrane subunit [Xanthobacteraceae bacterium]